jgi:F-type H+-transporting ATPase subunit b
MARTSIVSAGAVALFLALPAGAAQPTVEHAEAVAAEAHAHGTDTHSDAHDGAEHGEGHGAGHHEAHLNWAQGFIGESDEEPPGLAWRPVGTPPPVLAGVFNAALLFFILYKFGRAPVAEGLRKRKARIVAGMNEAAKMKREAEETLEGYEEKLRHIDEEIERIRREMREAAEAERKRILEDAKERRARMEREAKVLIEQELKAARDALMEETVRAAVRTAEELLKSQVTPQDHERVAKEYVELLASSEVNATGGRA